MKRLLLILLVLSGTAQAQLPDLVTGRAFVTGTRLETRIDGLATALRHVLVKRSGNWALEEDPRVDRIAAHAESLLADLAYLDRMTDLPRHDEQGTRDRPFDLIARFAPDKLDEALRSLGERPYLAPRPDIVVQIDIDDHGEKLKLSADGEADERQRQALLAAADRFGLHVVLTPREGSSPAINRRGAVLSGSLVWSEADFGWVGSWKLQGLGPQRSWGIKGVSFDEAYRNAMAGTLAALTHHKLPTP